MAFLSFAQVRSLRSLVLACLLPLLTLACAGEDLPRYDGEPVALKIDEHWDLSVEEPADGFFDTVDRNAEDLAKMGGIGTGVVGCVAGAVVVTYYLRDTTGMGGVIGCVAGGIALLPVGYVAGYGAGAVAGSVQGAINAFSAPGDEIDMQALLEAFESATPSSDLMRAMHEQAQERSNLPITWSEAPGESGAAGPHERQDPAYELSLTITRLGLDTTTSLPPDSRLRVDVLGRLRDIRTGQAVGHGDWCYASEPRATAELAADDAKALKAELAAGWQKLAEEILTDLFEPDR